MFYFIIKNLVIIFIRCNLINAELRTDRSYEAVNLDKIYNFLNPLEQAQRKNISKSVPRKVETIK